VTENGRREHGEVVWGLYEGNCTHLDYSTQKLFPKLS
jgi:hypothetical protein